MKKNISVLVLFFLCVACGKMPLESSNASPQPLSVVLKMPAKDDEALFWRDVTERRLLWEASGNPVPVVWKINQNIVADVDISTGGNMRFEGLSKNDEVLVTGNFSFSAEQAQSLQTIIIPIQRNTLY